MPPKGIPAGLPPKPNALQRHKVAVPASLSDADLQFCREYVRDLDLTGTARRCGMTRGKAKRMLDRKDIEGEITRLASVRLISEDYARDALTARMVELIEFDPIDLRDPETGQFRSFDKMPASARRAIDQFDVYESTADNTQRLIKVKLLPRIKGMELLARRFGMLVDKVRVDVVHSMLPPEVLALLNFEETARIRQLLVEAQAIVSAARQRREGQARRAG